MNVAKIIIAGIVFLFSIPAILLVSCERDKASNIPDVSDIKVDIDLTRFEQLLLADTTINPARLQNLMREHPSFSEVYFNYVIPKTDDIEINTNDEEVRFQNIASWIKHPRTRWLYDTIQQIYPDLKEVESSLESAFQYAKYYFPEKETPRVYTTISDFGYFPFLYAEDSLRDGIGISLEMFAGEKFPYLTYTGLNNAFSDYLTRSYNKDHITRRALEIWVEDLKGDPTGNRLIDLMIDRGKKLYILESLMPHAHDSVIIDYPSVKLNYVENNEREIWYHFTTQDLLYETSLNKIQKYIGPSPTSPGMPTEAPGNTGSWLGWQIVRAYMKSHPGTTLKELIAMQDAQALVDQSGYRPPR
jgi:hypothetical protein